MMRAVGQKSLKKSCALGGPAGPLTRHQIGQRHRPAEQESQHRDDGCIVDEAAPARQIVVANEGCREHPQGPERSPQPKGLRAWPAIGAVEVSPAEEAGHHHPEIEEMLRSPAELVEGSAPSELGERSEGRGCGRDRDPISFRRHKVKTCASRMATNCGS